jgi:hypothetical protein
MNSRLSSFVLTFFTLLPNTLYGQPIPAIYYPFIQNPPQYAIPFLSYTPDARAGSLGDAGVASCPDINSQHWNPAKYAFMEDRAGVALSYTPWMRKVVSDINLFYVAGFYRIDHKQFISSSLRYFDMGEIFLTTSAGAPWAHYRPADVAVDAAYSRKMSEHWSMALAFRYIRSDLKKVSVSGITRSELAASLAGDLAFYHSRSILLLKKDSRLSFGMNLSNMGRKIYYAGNTTGAFIPANLRLGGALIIPLGQKHSLSLMTDLNKLMVPTPPEYLTDAAGVTVIDAQGNPVIAHGMDPDVPVPLGILHSFCDAPGVLLENGKRSVLLEELHEITYSTGVEYWYREQFAIRAGYFHGYETKGNRKYFTVGAGLQLSCFALDFNYFPPLDDDFPLGNTFRLTAALQLDDRVNPFNKQ